ncbi:MAG: alpha/beta hydrolase [Smithellaceae bacterium]|nr:alpha/beta hydrolase [Smithellaceae bacterium]
MKIEIPASERPERRTENIGDADVCYLFYDGPDGAIVFLHATGFLPWLWHPIARTLRTNHQIVAPYFCDHRETEPEEGGLSWMVMAKDMADLCENLSLRKPLLVGHSMGATVLTMACAAYGLDARGLILIEPIFLPQELYQLEPRVEYHPLASKSIKRTNYWSDEAAAMEYLRSRSLFQKWDEEMLRLYIAFGMRPGETGGLELVCSPRREASLFMGGMHYDPWPLLPKVSCPVLILEGEESENRSYIDLKKAVSLFPRAEYRLVAEAGHLIPMEKPQEIAAIIEDYSRHFS